MSSPKTYTIALQFGHLVRLNELTAYLALTFQGAEKSPVVRKMAPDLPATLKEAREAISTPMMALLIELIRQRVPSPGAVPRPPDYLVLHLVLSEQLLQQLGELATAIARSWQDIAKLLPANSAQQPRLVKFRKDSAEVAGYLLSAMADAGVPDVPARV